MTRPVFPTVDDLPGVDRYDAARALAALYRLRQMGLAKVYTSAGSNDTHWNAWLEITARRVEVRAWVREWLASQEPDGPEAA